MDTLTQLSKQQLEKLNEQLPQEAITNHPTKPYLSSIKAIYVTERFNDVFGVGAWTADAKVVDPNDGAPVLYVTFEVPEIELKLSQFGGNDNGGKGNKNYDLGDAYKGAMTDALTKIGSYLGIGADVFKGQQDHNTKTEAPKAKNNSKPKTNGKKKEPKSDNLAQPFLDRAKKAKDRKEAVGAFTDGMNSKEAGVKEAVAASRKEFMEVIDSMKS